MHSFSVTFIYPFLLPYRSLLIQSRAYNARQDFSASLARKIEIKGSACACISPRSGNCLEITFAFANSFPSDYSDERRRVPRRRKRGREKREVERRTGSTIYTLLLLLLRRAVFPCCRSDKLCL